MKWLLLLLILSEGVMAATIESSIDGKRTHEKLYSLPSPSMTAYIGTSCYGNAAVTADVTLYRGSSNNISNRRTMNCGSANPLATAGRESNVRAVYEFMNTSLSSAEITIAMGIMGSGTAWPEEKLTVPGKSVCSMNYEPVVDFDNVYIGEAFGRKKILTKGVGAGKIVIKPTNTDSYGGFITSSEGEKIYLYVIDSNGAVNWDYSLKSWTGSNALDYFVNSSTEAKKPGFYSGTMGVTISCN
ncbi:hypothetical protein Q8V93_003410 [Enterobacter asburiae]|nr:hypothetical protein [Enterobacter asburiae]